MQDYFISILYFEEDAGYIADIPDLRFCSTFGATPEETLAKVQVARQAWLDAARAGKQVSARKYRLAITNWRSPRMPEN